MLKYKFIAQYDDETLFEQNEDDVSSKDLSRSAFSDVDQDRLTGFALQGAGHLYAVDLLDGHFEIDNVPFKMYDMEVANRRLIFFRRHRHNYLVVDGQELDHEMEYHFGWQGNEVGTGKNIQRVMVIS